MLCEYLIIMDVLCVGCGDDLSLKPKEKRILGSESSKPVLEFIQEVNDEEIDA